MRVNTLAFDASTESMLAIAPDEHLHPHGRQAGKPDLCSLDFGLDFQVRGARVKGQFA
jgi:hypothetical protein